VTKWKDGIKNGLQAVGLGMELWTDEEFSECDKSSNHPRMLCSEKNVKNELTINQFLQDYGCEKTASKMYRKDLFGMQARYEFCGDDQIPDSLNDLRLAIEETAKELSPENISSHKIKQLQYNPSEHNFYDQYMPTTVVSFVFLEIEKIKKANYAKFLINVKNSTYETYSHFFETYVRNFLMYGFVGNVRHLDQKDAKLYVFDRILNKGDFVYKIFSNEYPFQILLEEEDKEDSLTLLGMGAYNFLNPILLSPTKSKCATFDNIIIHTPSNRDQSSHIIFIQTTTMNKPPVKFSGILGMLLLAMTVQINTGHAPRLSFAFVVPNDLFDTYTAPDAEDLEKVFGKINIFVVSVSDHSKNEIGNNFYLEANSTFTVSCFDKTIPKKVNPLNPATVSKQNLINFEPKIDIFRLFTKWDDLIVGEPVGLLDPKFKNIRNQIWQNVNIFVNVNTHKVIANVIEKNKKDKGMEKEEEINEKKNENENEADQNIEKEEQFKKQKRKRENIKIEDGRVINVKNDFENLYEKLFKFVSTDGYCLSESISFSTLFSKEFICKVLFCLNFDVTGIEEETSNISKLDKYVLWLTTTKNINLKKIKALLNIFEYMK
jgi:hypothetical protein